MIVPKKSSWIRTVFRVRGSTLTKTWPRLLSVFVVAVAVQYIHDTTHYLHSNLTLTPFTLIGLALGIFLGFRNNTSYDRFWEGRKLWGRIVNASRTFTRQLMTLVGVAEAASLSYLSTGKGEADEEVRSFHSKVTHLLVAYVHSLRQHLRSQDRIEEYQAHLPAGLAEQLKTESNRPIAILHRIGSELRGAYDRGWVHAMHLATLEGSLTELAGVQGGCERIRATPIPFSYNILLHRIVFVYCFTLPFGLIDLEGLGRYTPIVTLLVSYAFFGLDAVGDEIEDPFGEDDNDLPLSAITTMIETNIRQRLGEDDLPAPKIPIKEKLS